MGDKTMGEPKRYIERCLNCGDFLPIRSTPLLYYYSKKFCSRQCQGAWLGTNYGSGMPLEKWDETSIASWADLANEVARCKGQDDDTELGERLKMGL